jgi:O-antigen/teichoic acid export membrane protein
MTRWKELLAGKFRQDVVWNLASLGVLSVCGTLLLILIGRTYDEATLGVFQQTATAYFIFSQLAVAGIDRSTLRAVAAHADDRVLRRSIIGGALVSTIVLAGLVTAFYWASIPWLATWFHDSPRVPIGLAASAPGLFFFALNKVLLAVVNGVQRMRAFAVYQALRYLLLLLGLVGFLVFDVERQYGDRLAAVFSIEEIVLSLVLGIEVWRQMSAPARGEERTERRGTWRTWSGEHLRYGVKSVASGVLLEINTYVDTAMIGHFMTDTAVGVYAVASQIAQGLFQILWVLQNVYNPILAREIAGRRFDELMITVRRGRRWTYAGMAIVGLAAVYLYPFVVDLMFAKPGFLASWGPFNYLMIGTVLAAGYIPFAQTLLMSGHPGWHTLYMVATVICNVIGNWILIPILGIEGAAISTGGALFLSVFILKATVRWRVGLRI